VHVESVNIGRPEPTAAKSGLSGIRKCPTARPVAIGLEGLEGDAIVDRAYHGGPDQAVYVYLRCDYDWWQGELGRAFAPGSFGENLTIAGLDGAGLGVGDRLAVGEAEIEITCHRSPCSVFAAHMGDPRWPKRFRAACRPGAYCRVIVPGLMQAGDAVAYTPYPGEPVLLAELVPLEARRFIDAATLRRCLVAPLQGRMRGLRRPAGGGVGPEALAAAEG
jgi:MOSC domain-containing protein YiiM